MLTLSGISHHRYRVIYLTTGLLVCVAAAWLLLAPRTPKAAEYKFMHCKTCETEREYDGKSTDLKCTKCKKTVTFIPTVASIKAEGNPRKSFYVAVSLLIIAYMGLLLLLVKPRPKEVEKRFLYCNCPKCKWRLRFKETSANKDGQCPRCKKVFRFPSPEIADTKEFPTSKNEPVEAWPE